MATSGNITVRVLDMPEVKALVARAEARITSLEEAIECSWFDEDLYCCRVCGKRLIWQAGLIGHDDDCIVLTLGGKGRE